MRQKLSKEVKMREEVKLISLRMKAKLNEAVLSYGEKYGLTRTAVIEKAVEHFLSEEIEHKSLDKKLDEVLERQDEMKYKLARIHKELI